MIKATNLTKKYGFLTAVDNVCFNIEKGHIYGFLGPNGAGKTTIMNMITGVIAPSAGSVSVCGYDISESPLEAKRHIGYLPEIPPLYTELTPYEYLSFVGKAKGVKGAKLDAAVKDAMRLTDTLSVGDRLIRNLSKGYRQRVGIAQAIIGDPDILIFDEPTVGLDPKQVLQVRQLIKTLGKNRTVILSSHILSEIEEICDMIIIISGGKLIDCDRIDVLQKKYADQDVLYLTVKCGKKRAEDALRQIKSGEKIEITEITGGSEISVNIPKSRDIREQLFFAFAKAGIPILEMKRKVTTLEDLFLKATSKEPEEEETEQTPRINIATPDKKDERPKSRDDTDDENYYRPLFGGKKNR